VPNFSPLKAKKKSRKTRTPLRNNARAGPSKEMNVIDLTSDSEADHNSEPDLSAEEDMYDDVPRPLAQRQRANQMVPQVNGRNVPQAAPQQPPAPEPANQFGGGQDLWGDFILDDGFDDENFARALANGVPQGAQPYNDQPVVDLERETLLQQPGPHNESKDGCVANVLVVFPDICSEHVSELFDKVAQSPERLVAHILDKVEKGSPYPKAKDKQKNRKRKREIDDDEAAELKYGAVDRAGTTDANICLYM